MKILTKKRTTYWIDLFCGAGGTSTGIHLSNPNHKVLACVNHDQNAIRSHALNHPETIHFTEDIRDFKVIAKIKILVDKLRKREPNCRINLWASLECTNFSRAKGGLPRDADSRTLADHMYHYIEAIKPDMFYVENVREFLSWGPLDENGRPISKDNGIDFQKWVMKIAGYGFKYEWRILNSADYGSYQTRRRLFIQFSKTTIHWPHPTHSEKTDDPLFSLEKWKPVKDVLELENKGACIFDKKRSLKTYERIYRGLIKEFKNHFLTSYYGNGDAHSIEKPIGTITTKDRYAFHYLSYDYSSLTTSSIDQPAGTITTVPKHNLVSVGWLTDTQFGRVSKSLDQPCMTVIARQDKKPIYLLQAERGYPGNFIKENDEEIVKKIKIFMVENYIKKIWIRMLNISELKQIQGFPTDYQLVGTQAEQKKFIGNAVEVNMARQLVNCIQN